MNTERLRGFEVVTGYEDKGIELPIQMTQYSAGYDFEAAEDIVIPPIWKEVFRRFKILLTRRYRYFPGAKFFDESNEKIKPTRVPTGIKAYMKDDEVLKLYNRSSSPLKLFLILANGVGVVDSDFYHVNGHIHFPFINFGFKNVLIKKGQRIGQGVFQTYLNADLHSCRTTYEERKGGEGSTNE